MLPRFWPWGKKRQKCPNCGRQVPLSDGRIMGDSFSYWAGQLQSQLGASCRELPVLTKARALAALQPGLAADHVRLVPGLESLKHYVAQLCRQALCDQAHGREATVQVVSLTNPEHEASVGILARSSVESGEKEREALVARIGQNRFIIYTPSPPTGRVSVALHAQRGLPADHGSTSIATPA
jgi:hypothetical protein